MSPLSGLARMPRAVIETANILLTTDDAVIGATPREVVWTHRKTTLYRYKSNKRTHAVPVLLVFALINRPAIFDLRPGNSFVEFLLDQGFDVFLVDWGVPGDEDGDMGVDNYVCDELTWAIREVRRASGSPQLTLLGWCIGAALAAIWTALRGEGTVRNLVLLTMPVDAEGSVYQKWTGRDSFDVDQLADAWDTVPGRYVDLGNRLLKPVTNFITTRRRLFEQVERGTVNRTAHQAMAKWVDDNPPFPSRAFRQWITWMYKENRLARGTLQLRGERVNFSNIRQSVLVVTAGADHIAPRELTLPIFDMLGSDDVEHIDRPGGHIGLMAGSKARKEIWPDIAGWLSARSGSSPTD